MQSNVSNIQINSRGFGINKFLRGEWQSGGTEVRN